MCIKKGSECVCIESLRKRGSVICGSPWKKNPSEIGSPYNVLIVHKPIRISEASGGAFFERPKLRLQAGSSSCQSLLGNQ